MGKQWNWAYNPYKWSSIITLSKAGSGAHLVPLEVDEVSNGLKRTKVQGRQ